VGRTLKRAVTSSQTPSTAVPEKANVLCSRRSVLPGDAVVAPTRACLQEIAYARRKERYVFWRLVVVRSLHSRNEPQEAHSSDILFFRFAVRHSMTPALSFITRCMSATMPVSRPSSLNFALPRFAKAARKNVGRWVLACARPLVR